MEINTETKAQIRAKHLKIRNDMIREEREAAEEKINAFLSERLKQSNCLQNGVYGYYPLKSEVSLITLYKHMFEEKIPLAFPRVDGMTMEFYQITSFEEMKEGAFHILEPKSDCPKALLENAICLVPGVAFDKQGNRYGYGKGYYDRYFSAHKNLIRIGVAYANQIEENIPTEETDIKMQEIICENGWISQKYG